ncbi:MAG TPA: M20/M25/M40 family metallo-hydrolase [Vicinamibacterales bacterium]|nr:M20/M25/M40 family metallo-hydrolase [Vicinamibacterales bacterium]
MRIRRAGPAIAGVLVFTTSLSSQAPSSGMPRANDDRFAKIIQTISADRVADIDRRLVSFGTRASTSESTSTETRGVVPARKWIYEQFQAISAASGGRLKVSIDTFPVPKGNRIPADQTMSNVVAVLPGTDPTDTRVVVVSGHYDSIPGGDQDGPGANDDASGTVVSLECARALAPFQFPATIMFLAVEGEEQGLYGSKHAAESARAAGMNIVAMLNNDIVGGDQTPGRENKEVVRVFSQGVPPKATPEEITRIASAGLENDSPSREVARYASAIADAYLSDFRAVLEYRPDRFQRGGDHSSFLDNGYAAVRFSEFNENSQHQHQAVREENGIEYGDVFKWISPSYIANVARVNALTLASIASAPAAPETVTFQAGQQPTGTAVTWTAVPGAASYRVLLRPTADSQWSIRLPAPAVPAPARAAGGGRSGRAGAGSAGAGAAGAGSPPATPAAPPTGPMYQVTVPQSGDNYYIAIVAVDAAGHESLPKLAGPPPRGGGARGGGR